MPALKYVKIDRMEYPSLARRSAAEQKEMALEYLNKAFGVHAEILMNRAIGKSKDEYFLGNAGMAGVIEILKKDPIVRKAYKVEIF